MAKCELCGLEMLEAKDRIKTSVPEEEKDVHTPSAAILIPIVRDKDGPALLRRSVL